MHTCLVVDESEVIRKVAARIMFQMGMVVDGAESADAALKVLREGAMPDLIIVAGTLPDQSGEDAVRAIRSLPSGERPVILGLLVDENLGKMTRLKRAGANGFIYKPFDRERLAGWLSPYIGAAA
ncbi:response regulator [Consotaella salsifontis]|uniref:Two-component system, chemotaxis family, response regulator CheY n=1 Tax=Consotaella salsifontis TaxID=1365950 RepID=A0A1T4REF0_9HYPH|nr:response regulator [Consotaella salsifontis]SKA14128.1 two-component system, chemotaxis family, response regulator CheY [Consotaella salsifontis]